MELDRSYRVLGLRTDADIPEVRTAYRKLALRYHPDRNRGAEATETFAAINEAYNTILNSHVIAGGPIPARDHEGDPDGEGGKMSFTILSDKERIHHVSPIRFESEVRKHFNPGLPSGIYCKVGERWFEIDSGARSTWSPFRLGSKGRRSHRMGPGPAQRQVEANVVGRFLVLRPPLCFLVRSSTRERPR